MGREWEEGRRGEEEREMWDVKEMVILPVCKNLYVSVRVISDGWCAFVCVWSIFTFLVAY